jgi:hypothetical protein
MPLCYMVLAQKFVFKHRARTRLNTVLDVLVRAGTGGFFWNGFYWVFLVKPPHGQNAKNGFFWVFQ